MSKLGETIKTLREQRGMKQVELASIVNVEPSRVSQWETGARGVPLSLSARLAEALGVGVDQLALAAAESETLPTN